MLKLTFLSTLSESKESFTSTTNQKHQVTLFFLSIKVHITTKYRNLLTNTSVIRYSNSER